MFGLFKRGGSRRRFRSRKNRNFRRRTFRGYRGYRGGGGDSTMDLKGVRNSYDLPGSTGESTFNPGNMGTGASQYHKPL